MAAHGSIGLLPAVVTAPWNIVRIIDNTILEILIVRDHNAGCIAGDRAVTQHLPFEGVAMQPHAKALIA